MTEPVASPEPVENRLPGQVLLYLAALAVLAAYVWLRDRAWQNDLGNSLPILSGFALLYALGRPWQWDPDRLSASLSAALFRTGGAFLYGGGALFLLGVALNLSFLLALGWTFLLWALVDAVCDVPTRRRAAPLMPLAALSFPWLILHGNEIGWVFRLSGAIVTEKLFSLIGLHVVREGVFLLIQGLPVSVDAPCAGISTLQAMLLAGTVMAVSLPRGKRMALPVKLLLLVAVAWGANTLRLVVLCASALTWGVPFAQGWFHEWGGLSVLVLMFVLCFFLFGGSEDPVPTAPKP
ncbi:MAG: hypothetical protein OHK0029_12290 [Armatimonadaceae bacterium]